MGTLSSWLRLSLPVYQVPGQLGLCKTLSQIRTEIGRGWQDGQVRTGALLPRLMT